MYWPTLSTRIKANEAIKFRPFIRPEISKKVYLPVNILMGKGYLQISTVGKKEVYPEIRTLAKRSVLTPSEHILSARK